MNVSLSDSLQPTASPTLIVAYDPAWEIAMRPDVNPLQLKFMLESFACSPTTPRGLRSAD
jgi:hypothetical protein